ncbi:YihY family inner membrane protein [Porticoccaceae bacterium LTM1]|nr:YihY family inner membrane protein [Porticoccaceae bacterium LTM1]
MSQLMEVVKARTYLVWQFVHHVGTRFFRDGCQERAAALTYMTLFALVPMLTVTFTMLSFIPDFQGMDEKLQSLLFDYFLPEVSHGLQDYINGFMVQARKLSWFGVAILVVTSYMMLVNIEKAFNKIWGTVGRRRGLTSFLLYWAILSLGPLLVGVGLWMNAYLLSYQWLVDEYDTLGLVATLFQVLPLLLTWVVATLLFVAVPNCRVRFRDALLGGLLTTLLFEGLQAVFGVVVAHSSFRTVYGAFAVVPLFLLWVYMVWTLLLIGAELVRGRETFKAEVQGFHFPNLVAALLVLYRAYTLQQRGAGVTDRHMLKAGIDQQHWQSLRNMMLENNLLAVSAKGQYLVTRDLRRVTIAEIVSMFGEQFTAQPSAEAAQKLERYDWFRCLSRMLSGTNEHLKPLMHKSVGDLFDDNKESEPD